MVRVLGIGLPKTGTSSLNEGLRILGLNALHSPRPIRARYFRSQFDFGEWDAITNLFEHSFPAIDALYPGTRFIRTVRHVEPWLASVKQSFSALDRANRSGNAILPERLTAVQCSHYNEPILRHVHRYHELAVLDYFADRPGDVLHLDICGGEGWERLCDFLGVDIPAEPFPHKNPISDYG